MVHLEIIKRNLKFCISLILSLFLTFIVFIGCEEKVDNPVNIQASEKEWTCVECHTNQAELSMLADYMVGGEGEEGG